MSRGRRKRKKHRQNPDLLAALLAQRARHDTEREAAEAAAAALPPPPPPPPPPAPVAAELPLLCSRSCGMGLHRALRARPMQCARDRRRIDGRIMDVACSRAVLDRRAAWSLRRVHATRIAMDAARGVLVVGDAHGNLYGALQRKACGLPPETTDSVWSRWPGHGGRVCGAEFIAPGRLVTATTGDAEVGGALHFFRHNDDLSLQPLCPALETDGAYWSMAATTTTVAAGHGPVGGVTLVDAATSKTTREWRCTRSALWSCAFAGDNTLVVGSRTGAVQLWDLRSRGDRTPIAAWNVSAARDAPAGVVGIVAIDDGRRLVVGATSGNLAIWDRRRVVAASAAASTAASSAGARGRDGAIGGGGAAPACTLRGHTNSHRLLELCVGPSDRVVYAGGDDGVVRSWSTTTGEPLLECGAVAPPTNSFPGLLASPALGLRCGDAPNALWAATRDGVRVVGLRPSPAEE